MKRNWLLIAAGVLCACSHSPTDPTTPPFIVTVTGPSSVKGQVDTINGTVHYTCSYTLKAAASGGSAGEVATWVADGGTITFSNGQVFGPFTDANPSEFFNANSTIAAGPQQSWAEQIVTPAGYPVSPFQLALVVYYSTRQTSRDSATYSLTCQ